MQNVCSKSSNPLVPAGSYGFAGPVPHRPARRRGGHRRIVVLAIVVSMALSVVWAPRLVAVTSPDPQDATHVVRQGDTLWGVARLHASERTDPRAVVDQIRRLNGLSTAQLSPGQELKLPPQG